MAGHTNTTTIQTAFTARAAVGGYVLAPSAKLSVTVPPSTWMTSRPRVPLTTA